MQNKKPPIIAQWILKRFFSDGKNQTANGDFEEVFLFKVKESGLLRAQTWYWLQIIWSIKSFIIGNIFWSGVMFKSYLKITFRKMRRQKGYSFINISGLALGIACCILIIAYITTELSYDKFHLNADQIYRLGTKFDVGTMKVDMAVSNDPAGPTIVEKYPEVKNSTRFRRFNYRALVEYENKKFFEENVFFADNSVFEIFSFPMIKGDPATALRATNTIVLSVEMASKYFANEDPIGKVLTLDNGEQFTVTGIIKNVPQNSHIRFNMLCSFETYRRWNKEKVENWTGDFSNYTYFLLQDKTNYLELEKKFPALIDEKIGHILKQVGGSVELILQPLTSIHLHSNLDGEISGNSDIVYIYIFAIIALFILFIACINFMNLTTARSTNRAKEVGMRKVLGANRGRLINQFFGESLIFSFLSLVFALIIVRFSLPFFSSIADIELTFNFQQMLWLIPGLIGIAIFVGFMAGIYPSLFLSAFLPAKVLQGSIHKGKANTNFRNVLVVVQFTISIALISGTAIIMNQLDFMKNKKLGFDKEHVVVLPILDNSIRQSIESIKHDIRNIPGIANVSITSHVPGFGARHNAFVPEGFSNEENRLMSAISIDHNFLATLGIEIINGRNFSPEFTTDPQNSILINETAVNDFGWQNPIGKTITELDGNETKKTVIGVVKDFHIMSLKKAIIPVYIENNPSYFGTVAIRLEPGNISETIKTLEKKWKKIDPTGTFDYTFLDQNFDNEYRAEERLSSIFSYFTLFAIFIACLGLFGLASFIAEQRTKEIGIRKVLGASISKIIIMLSKEFVKWIVLANLIAWPFAYFVMNRWLQNFAYQTNLGFDIFLYSGIIALVISLFTVSYQSIKAALTNPADSLKYE